MNKTMTKLLSLCKKSSKQVSSAQYLLEYMEMLIKIEELEKNGTNAATLKSLKAIRDTYKSPYDKKRKLSSETLIAYTDPIPMPSTGNVVNVTGGTLVYRINASTIDTETIGLFDEEDEETNEE